VRRLRLAEWLAALAGVGLVVTLGLDWYGVRGRETGISAFAAFGVIDLLLVLVAATGVALAVLQATQDRPSLPVGAAVVSVTVGLFGILLVLYRIANEPGPDEFVDVRAPAYLGLLATIALTAGGWRSLADEEVRGLPPGPEPELRPAPRIAADAEP
jgi:hypothetical protein